MTDDRLEGLETAIPLQGILQMFGFSRRKFFYMKDELQDSGVIFYRMEGKPARPRIYAFPSRIIKWISHKSKNREVI